jgi:hypothetical protein
MNFLKLSTTTMELIQTIITITIKLLLHGKGIMKNLFVSKYARTSLDIIGYRQSASWLPDFIGISPVSCLCCQMDLYFFLSFKEDLNA